MRTIICSFCFFLFAMLRAGPNTYQLKTWDPPQSHLVAPINLSPPFIEHERIAFADELLSRTEFTFTQGASKKGKVVTQRPVLLACFSKNKGEWSVVQISIPYPTPESYFRNLKRARTIEEREKVQIPLFVQTPGYKVTHRSGAGATRLRVDVVKIDNLGKIIDDSLVVYRMSFVRMISPGKIKGVFTIKGKVPEAVRYTPMNSEFDNKRLADFGLTFLRKHIEDAKSSLRSLGVHSRVDTSLSVADIFPTEVILSLMINEQWDPLYFREYPKESMQRILAEYGLNRENSFAWSVSSANAVGCLQFTNKGGKGTYANVVREYKEAAFVKDFEFGARDMHNIIKMAICLLDLELSQNAKAKLAYKENKYIGSIYPVAAYNGGPKAGTRIIEAIERLAKKSLKLLTLSDIHLPSAIHSSGEAYQKIKGKKVKMRIKPGSNSETPLYARKYLYIATSLAD